MRGKNQNSTDKKTDKMCTYQAWDGVLILCKFWIRAVQKFKL